MTTLAFLGLGAMGQRMARRLAGAGHDLIVWNRSGLPAGVASWPARAAPTPRAAAAEADLVFSMVRDDDASETVWDDPETGALASLRPGAIAVESSTVTPARVAALAARVAATGAGFLDAPVVGSRPAAEAGTLTYLVGGPPDLVERARPVLAVMGSALHHVGPTPAGAIVKLMSNTLFGIQVAALAEILALGRRTTLDVARAAEVMGALPVMSPAARGALASMIAGQFEPMFPIDLVAKDLGYALALGGATKSALPLTQRTQERFAAAITQGLGGANLTALIDIYRSAPDDPAGR
jgi:3-hydroxyisobutyrate dehydrogenase